MMPNSRYGPYTFFHDQFSSLYSWRNIGTSDYNALQVTYNARWGANLEGSLTTHFRNRSTRHRQPGESALMKALVEPATT